MAAPAKKIMVWANNVGQPLTNERSIEPEMVMNDFTVAPLLNKRGDDEPSQLFLNQQKIRRDRRQLEHLRREHEGRPVLAPLENIENIEGNNGSVVPGAFASQRRKEKEKLTRAAFRKTIHAALQGHSRDPAFEWLYGAQTEAGTREGGLFQDKLLLTQVYHIFNTTSRTASLRDRILYAMQMAEVPGVPGGTVAWRPQGEAEWNALQSRYAAEAGATETNRGSRAPWPNANTRRRKNRKSRKTRKSRR